MLELFGIPALVSALVSGVILLFGRFWVEKKLSEQNASLDKSKHVHRVQFEKEFQIYQEIWALLVELKHSTESLRPMFDQHNPNEDKETRKRKRLQQFGESYNNFLKSYLNNQPFYAQDVFDCLSKIKTTARHEAIDYELLEQKDKEYWEQSKKNSDEIYQLINECVELIRQRVNSLDVS